jgi:hypothetical protein
VEALLFGDLINDPSNLSRHPSVLPEPKNSVAVVPRHKAGCLGFTLKSSVSQEGGTFDSQPFPHWE